MPIAASTLPGSLACLSPAELGPALSGDRYDALVLIGPAPFAAAELPSALASALTNAMRADASIASDARACTCIPADGLPGGRLVLSTTGSLASWELDARPFGAAAALGMARALAAGAKRPLFVVHAPRTDARFARAGEVAALAALGALWRPLELRIGADLPLAADAVGFALDEGPAALEQAVALERARIVARDITGTEPELMSPEGIARYCEEEFHASSIRVDVERDAAAIARAYPLLGAVARASGPVARHHARVVRLAYEGEGPITRTLLFAGKGLAYDTGGADLKTDGHMAGMSRDKGGAGAVAGLFRLLAERRPRGVRAIGLLGAVRNDIGSDAFVSDEILIARSGIRVRVGNTDAEGRLVLADLLAALREEAAAAPNPLALSIATLTGHAALAYGPYTAVVENGVALARGFSERLVAAGEIFGDPVERSRMRPEDYAFISPKSLAEGVLSCNSLPSSRTPRGHQFPAAFLDVVSGLRAHDLGGSAAIGFAHIDIAGSAVAGGSWATGVPTGAPIVALGHALELL